MAWTPPKTFIENEVLTAADLNQYLRDNLLENEVMKATTAGSRLSTDLQGNLVERTIGHDVVNASESRICGPMVQTSPSFYLYHAGPYDLGTPGPTVTIRTGTRALVFMSASMKTTLKESFSSVSIDCGFGVDVVTSSSNRLVNAYGTSLPQHQGTSFWITKSSSMTMGEMCYFSGLTPGLNTFTMRYFIEGPEPVFSGPSITGWTDVTSTFSNRRLMVIPL